MRHMIRIQLRVIGLVVVLLPLVPGPLQAQLQDQTQVRPTNDLSNPYTRVHPWGELPNAYVPGAYDE